MAHRTLRACACAAWVWVVSTGAAPDQGAPPAPALDASVQTPLQAGEAALRQGKLERAEELLGQALSAQEGLGRADVHTGRILSLLSDVAIARADLGQAQAYLDRALSLLQRVGPESLEMAEVLNNLGVVAGRRGHWDRAEEHYRRGLALYEEHGPGRLGVAILWNNLGLLARYRGDLVSAEQHYLRALALKEKVDPHSLSLAITLNNLSRVAEQRRDFASAESYSRRSLAVSEAVAPDSMEVAAALTNLGGIVRRRGDLAAAGSHLRRALAIRERLAPGSQFVAESLTALGLLARQEGSRKRAEALARRALAIDERVQPGSLRVAARRRWLAELAIEGRRWDEAERHLAVTISIYVRLQPDSIGETRTRHAHGRLLRQRGRLPEAEEELRRAIDILEAQIDLLGGTSEDRTDYRAQRNNIYADLIDVLVALGRAPEAFHVLERSRARGLLEMMAGRDLAAAEHAPAGLEADRRHLAWRYDLAQKRLAEKDGRGSTHELARLQDELRQLRRRHSELVDEIRRHSARPSLRYPEPLDLTQTMAALEAGTLLLSYAVGDERTHLFAVSREDGLTVATLPSGRTTLQRDVELFRRLIQEEAPSSPRAAQLQAMGSRLYDRLVAPVAPRVGRGQRLLVVPDGPLHVLPFAALVREPAARAGARAHPHYLLEWKPLSTVLSATVYAELRRRPAADPPPSDTGAASLTLVAFGDPVLPAARAGEEGRSDGERSLLKQITALRPLPAARREVEQIAALFPGQAEAFVGELATEERVKRLSSRVRYVHFATHALLDHASPLDTALVLAVPQGSQVAGENGLLQAWEILEQLRLNVDLVALPACDSGLGRELRGEGLLGLTRAFQYAGARSVLASLWPVGDRPTAALMVRFYRHLKEGLAKDEALRAAQMELIGAAVPAPGRSGPARREAFLLSHWAAFQLHGDAH